MKTRLFMYLMIFVSAVCLVTAEKSNEKTAVRKAIMEGYINGVYLQGNPELVKQWWHENSEAVIYRKGELVKVSVSSFVLQLEKRSGPLYPGIKITFDIPDIKISGNAALVTVNIFFDGKQKYTDFMNLYKFPDGWKIVTKTYFSHF